MRLRIGPRRLEEELDFNIFYAQKLIFLSNLSLSLSWSMASKNKIGRARNKIFLSLRNENFETLKSWFPRRPRLKLELGKSWIERCAAFISSNVFCCCSLIGSWHILYQCNAQATGWVYLLKIWPIFFNFQFSVLFHNSKYKCNWQIVVSY